MNLSEDVNLEEVRDMRALVGLTDLLARVTSQYVMMKDEMSGADIKAMCTEVRVKTPYGQCSLWKVCFLQAGLLALRERRMRVTKKDFDSARDKVMDRKGDNLPAGLYLVSYPADVCLIAKLIPWVGSQ